MSHAIYLLFLNQKQTTSSNTSSSCNKSDPHLIHHPYLDSLNQVVNAEFCFLVCQLCREAVVTSTLKSHLANKHTELSSAYMHKQMQRIEAEHSLSSSLPSISGPRSIVHGLRLCDALACGYCPTVMLGSKNMREHHQKHHQDQPVPKNWWSCKAQRMKAEGAGSQCTLWEVVINSEEELSEGEVILADLMKDLDKQLENVQAPTDHWLVSPWLRSTHWHEYVAALDSNTERLHRWVALPHVDEIDFQELSSIVECYFQEAVALIDTTDELVLQWLNSPDPQKKWVDPVGMILCKIMLIILLLKGYFQHTLP